MNRFLPLLAFWIASQGIAQEAAAQAPTSQPSMLESMIPFVFIFIAMYFLMIRPQARKAKEQAALLNALKPGDEVITSGGILGRIKSINGDAVSLESGSTQFKILKDHISRLAKTEAPAPQKK